MSPRSCLLHLSDLHFGRIDRKAMSALEKFLEQKRSELNLVIITGDLTQRARTKEFMAARSFIESLKLPVFLVPGNHDVPLFNLAQRWLAPYGKYQHHLGDFSQQYYENELLAIFGLWTTKAFTVSTGYFRSEDILELKKKFEKVPAHKVKIIAAHHPLTGIERNASTPLTELLHQPQVLLWGHDHVTRARYLDQSQSTVLVSCGTTTSTRLRGEENGLNLLYLHERQLTVEDHVLDRRSNLLVPRDSRCFQL